MPHTSNALDEGVGARQFPPLRLAAAAGPIPTGRTADSSAPPPASWRAQARHPRLCSWEQGKAVDADLRRHDGAGAVRGSIIRAVRISAHAAAAHCHRHGRYVVALGKSFERTGTASGTCVAPITGLPARRNKAVLRSVPQAHDVGGRASAAPAIRVVVVEDDVIIGTLLAEMLVGMGHDVCAIEATEADAVSAAVRCKPDLMIVDVGLAEGSGISAIETIHRTLPVPHVFVSADVSRVQWLRPGSFFIQKPYRESDLARVIQQALDAAALH